MNVEPEILEGCLAYHGPVGSGGGRLLVGYLYSTSETPLDLFDAEMKMERGVLDSWVRLGRLVTLGLVCTLCLRRSSGSGAVGCMWALSRVIRVRRCARGAGGAVGEHCIGNVQSTWVRGGVECNVVKVN